MIKSRDVIDKESASDAPAIFVSRLHHHFHPNSRMLQHDTATRNHAHSSYLHSVELD